MHNRNTNISLLRTTWMSACSYLSYMNIKMHVSLVPRPTRKLKVGLVTRLEFCVPCKECGAGVGMQLEVV